MKPIASVLILCAFIVFNTGCVKDLLKKKKDPEPAPAPEAKYYGTWKATQLANDLNANNRIDANELFAFTGNSELKLNDGKTYTFLLSTSTGTSNMSGNWTMAADEKAVTITDATQGSLRFDYRNDTEIQTEPIPVNNGTVWIIYKKQ
jgi:hypothetical protein